MPLDIKTWEPPGWEHMAGAPVRQAPQEPSRPPGWEPPARQLPPEPHAQDLSPTTGGWCVQRPSASGQQNSLRGPIASHPAMANHLPPASQHVPANNQFEDTHVLETYLKDLHWLTEKIVLVTERSMLMIEEVHRDHLVNASHSMKTLPVITEESAITAKDRQHLDQTIRDAVSSMGRDITRSMEIRLREHAVGCSSEIVGSECSERSMEENYLEQSQTSKRAEWMQLATLGENMHKQFKENALNSHNQLQDHSKRLDAHEVHVAKAADAQNQVLDVMLSKVDRLSGLLDQMQMDPTTATFSKQNVPAPMYPAPVNFYNNNHATGPIGSPGPIRSPRRENPQLPPPAAGAKAADAKIVVQVEEKKEREQSIVVRPSTTPSTTSTVIPRGPVPLIERIAESSYFEMGFGFLIVLSTVKMCIEAEYEGWAVGEQLGIEAMLATSQATTEVPDQVFYMIELAFGVVFTIEVLVKLTAFGRKFWHCRWNIFDTVIISLSWFTTLTAAQLPIKPLLLRLFRLIRLLRLLRLLSHYELFDDLQLMVRALQAGAPVLIWVVVLLGPVIACISLAMTFTLVDFIQDVTKPQKERIECYAYFGTFSRSMLSMFEVTFGNWQPHCRFLYANVDERWALFFMFYKLFMGIAVLRVVYGVFLHVTFRCTNSNEELLAAQKAREDRKFARKIHEMFEHFDTDGTGSLSKEEFHEIAQDVHAQNLLVALDLKVKDAELVFDLADAGGDGDLSAEEMIEGFKSLKGFARSIDVGAIMHLQNKCMLKIDRLAQIDEKIDNMAKVHFQNTGEDGRHPEYFEDGRT